MKSKYVWAFLHSQKWRIAPGKAKVNVHSLVQLSSLRAGKAEKKNWTIL